MPNYVEVNVTVGIALVSLEKAGGVEREIRQALDCFLHPLMGGPDGNGWDFGREPHLSDLYARLQAVPGVDHICCLTVKSKAVPAAGLVCSGKQHSITLTLAEI